MERKCKYCDEIFNNKSAFGGHSHSCPKNPNSLASKARKAYGENPKRCSMCDKLIPYELRCNKFCNSSCAAQYNNKNRTTTDARRKKLIEKLKKPYKEIYNESPKECIVCGQKIEYEKRNRKTCSDKCFDMLKPPSKKKKRILTDAELFFIRNRKEIYETSPKKCKICGTILEYKNRYRKTCSNVCLYKRQLEMNKVRSRKGGQTSAQKQTETRRSKNERLFAEKCKAYFNEVLFNKAVFNGWDADVVIEDIKVAVLWNGVWHYKKITEKHSVKQVQNRDRIKIDEIRKTGYEPHVIKDMGKYNVEFVESEFKKFVKKFGQFKN